MIVNVTLSVDVDVDRLRDLFDLPAAADVPTELGEYVAELVEISRARNAGAIETTRVQVKRTRHRR